MTFKHDADSRAPGAVRNGEQSHHGGHSSHGWMMIACCIPMLVIAVALVATGVVGANFLVVAIACTTMMALMMGGMGRGGAR